MSVVLQDCIKIVIKKTWKLFKIIFNIYKNITLKLFELKEILKQKKIRGWSHLNKHQLIELQREKELLPIEKPKNEVKKNADPDVNLHILNPQFPWLSEARTHPKTAVWKQKKKLPFKAYKKLQDLLVKVQERPPIGTDVYGITSMMWGFYKISIISSFFYN